MDTMFVKVIFYDFLEYMIEKCPGTAITRQSQRANRGLWERMIWPSSF